MNDQLNYHAIMAWVAFGAKDRSGMEQNCGWIYNHFDQNPDEILRLDNPLLIGKVFQLSLGFQESDEEKQNVRAENAFLCFLQALNSDRNNVHDEACARMMMLLIQWQGYLVDKVEHACQSANANPYSFLAMIDDGFPDDMPIATNTKMLFTAYYLYDSIIDKGNVNDEFVNEGERRAFENVKNHVLDNCHQLHETSSDRKVELGEMVFKKIVKRLEKDVELR